MKEKFIFKNKKTGEVKKVKSLKEIEEILKIDYHQVRSIYIQNTKGKKHVFPITKLLCENYEIIDNPDYLNIKIIHS